MTNPCNSCELQGFLFMTYRSVTEWTSHTALRRGIQEYPVDVIPHRDAESRNTGKGRYPQATLYWTPHRGTG